MVPENLTKIHKNVVIHKNVKMSLFFPLYAKLPKKRDQNPSKMTQYFPLYADWGQKRDKNGHKMMVTKFTKNVTQFPLICKNGQKTAHKSVKNGHLFSLICILCRNL